MIAPMGAYYIGRIDNKFCKFLFTLIIASMSIPFQAVMIPMVVVGTMFHLINNIPGVIIIYVGLAIPFAVFMCTGALRYIPREIEESAYIDGATQFQTFWKIVFPMMQSTIVTVTILNTFWFWNDFILPQILLRIKMPEPYSWQFTSYSVKMFISGISSCLPCFLQSCLLSYSLS